MWGILLLSFSAWFHSSSNAFQTPAKFTKAIKINNRVFSLFAESAYISKLRPRIKRINELEGQFEEYDDDQFTEKTASFRHQLQNGVSLDEILEEAFALVREASWRVIQQRHYDVQLLAGIALHEGNLAEMATGEGKTLVATLPIYLNALTSEGSLVVTVNDYLAKRDAEKMGQIYKFLGLSVGLIQASMVEDVRKINYDCDVTYVTNSELGFAFLRDHLTMSPDGVVLRSSTDDEQDGNDDAQFFKSFCVVDEVRERASEPCEEDEDY